MSFPELIRSEEMLLQRLLATSQRQLEIVNTGSATVLVEHLGQQERLWHEFERLEQQLAPHKGIPSERRVWKSASERKMTEEALNRCKVLMEEIMAIYQISITKAAELMEKAEKDLRRIQLATPGALAYAKQSQL